MEIQLFRTFKSTEAQDLTPEQVFDLICKDEELKKSTELHRDLLAQGHEKAAKEVKESTPQVAASFRMEGGKGKGNCRKCLGNVLIDFDAKSPEERLPADELERVKTIMRTSRHALLGYESISGLGYHIIVPFRLPEGISIDMENDPQRSEEIFKRVHHYINNMYSVWCKHEMDQSCDNINRMTGLSHDPMVVYRSDAMPFFPTREELGIDADGNLIKMKTPKTVIDKSGNRITIPLGNRLERAVKMVEDSGMAFVVGNRHNYITRVSFILNRMGVDEEEAAQALDDAYRGKMDDRPSKVLHSCYKTAADEFGVWMAHRSKNELKTEIIACFLKEKALRYDVLTQKTQQKLENGRWKEMTERDENDLYLECCSKSSENFSLKLFTTVLNSNVVPEIHPLKDYVNSLPAWTPDKPDYIDQAASMVHMATPEADKLWHLCFKKWFVAMVAGWTNEDIANHQVIVFVGRQGIYKSTWLNRLLPPQLSPYSCIQTEMEHMNKDEQLRAAEYGLINLDELDKLSERGLNELKAQVTIPHVDVRASYGRHKEKRERVASYVGSGNKKEFLTDQTGNRRWLPFHVVSIDSPYENQLPYEGMYAQANYLIKEGKFNYWFDISDIEAMTEHVEEFMVPNSEEQLIQVYFSPVEPGQPGAEFLTLAEIAAKISLHGNLHRNIDLRHLGTIMTKLGFKKERCGHNRNRGYIVREHTDMEMDKVHNPKTF
ncbi:MAG: hypothetical protein IKH43_07925 [Bacteroidaceae bacterium]|nr:hypothetical protein [Bacteroidaceae bacterium]